MATSTLPSASSADLSLVEATPEELLAQQKAHFSVWGGALTEEAYLRRERQLFSQELTKDGALTPWVLVHQVSGSSSRQVVCGCESLKKRALVRRNGKVEEVIAHGIASVFSPPHFRGKGYAGRMMTEVNKRLRSHYAQSDKEILFSVLFSDIGKQFYTIRGWQPFPSMHVALSPNASPSSDGLPPVRSLRAEDLKELCGVDEKLLRARMAGLDKSRFAIALLPDHVTIEWHHSREEFIGQELFQRKPVIKGAMVGESGSRVWCYWSHVWTNPQEEAPDTLHILRLGVEDETFADFAPASEEAAVELLTQASTSSSSSQSSTVKAIAALFAAAQKEAAEWKMGEIVLWNPTSTSLAGARLAEPKARMEDREDESITSLLWYGEGSHEDVNWVCNEKFGWC